MTITNSGTATLTVYSITYPQGFSGNWSGGTIGAGSSQTVTVFFAPTIASLYSGVVSVNSNAISGVASIPCSGTGVVGVPVVPAVVTGGGGVYGGGGGGGAMCSGAPATNTATCTTPTKHGYGWLLLLLAGLVATYYFLGEDTKLS